MLLHRTLFGGERDLPESWAKQGFTFRENGFLCGLRQHAGGACGVLAVVQAYILRELALQGGAGRAAISASREQAGAALVAALAQIIWAARVGRLASVVVCKQPELPPMRQAAEALVKTDCNSLETVQEAVQAAAGAFIRPHGPGVAMLLYSVLMTRGVAMVGRDADFPSPLIMINGYCSQELVNLMTIGRAHSNVFDGEKVVGDPGEGARLRGIPRRSPIGFLTLFERQGEPGSLVRVGRYLKRPEMPIFVVQSESHYSVLWADAESRDFSVDDEVHAEDEDEQPPLEPDDTMVECADGEVIELHYFDQMGERDSSVRLTLSRRVGRALGPSTDYVPLENVILTRWPGAQIDWNGEEVIL